MWKRPPAIVLSLIAYFAICPEAFAADPVWIGDVTFQYSMSETLDRDIDDNLGKISEHHNETLSLKVVVKACGQTAERLRILDPEITTYVNTESYFRENKQEECLKWPESGGHLVAEIKKPGNKTKTEARFFARSHPAFAEDRSQPILSIDPENKTYILSISLEDTPTLLIDGSIQEETHYVCTDETSISDIVFQTLDTVESSECHDDGKRCYSYVKAKEKVLPLRAHFKGNYDGKRIKAQVSYPDSEAISEIELKRANQSVNDMLDSMKAMFRDNPELLQQFKEAEAAARKPLKDVPEQKPAKPGKKGSKKVESLQVYWSFKILDECQDIIDQLREDISFLRAYANDDLLKKVEDLGPGGEAGGKAYDMAVYREGRRQYASHWWESGYKPPVQNLDTGGFQEMESQVDLYLDNRDCSVGNKEKVKEEHRRKCYPKVIYDSILQHEETHARQCSEKDTREEFLSRTARSFQKFETEAYCVGIGILLDYAEKHCKDYGLKPYEKEYERLCSK